MKRIVVGTDGTESAATAIEWAARLSAATGATMTVATAWSAADDPDDLASEVARREHRLGLLEHEWSAPARRHDVAVETRLLEGAVRDELPSLATREDADLVVIGASCDDAHPHRLARDLVHHLHRPLAVVPRGTWPVSAPPVVGIDGSRASDAAFAWAVAVARDLGTGLTAVFAHDTLADSFPHADTDNWVYRGEPTVHDQVRRTADPAVAIDLVQEAGRPEAVLATVAGKRDATAIVVGTKGRGGLHGLIAGRVPIRLVQAVPRPVIIVPH